MDHRLLAIVLAIALSGCTGSLPAASPVSPFHNVPDVSMLGSLRSTSGTHPSASASVGTVTFTISVPQSARRARFVPPTAKSLVVVLETVNGGASKPLQKATFNLVANAKDCTKALSCTLSEVVPVGKDDFTVTLYSGLNANGSALGVATVSARVTTKNAAVVPLVPSGIPSTLLISPAHWSPLNDGNVHAIVLTISALDASGQTIVGSQDYTAPVTLAITGDPNGSLSLTKTSIAGPSASTVTLKYMSANGVVSGTVAAAAPHATKATSSVTPLTITPLVVPGIMSGALAAPQTISIQEAGLTSAYRISSSGTALGISCSPASCAPASTGGIVRVTLSAQGIGTGQLTITDPSGSGTALPYSEIGSAIDSSVTVYGDRLDALTRGPDGNIWAVLDWGGLARIATPTTYSLFGLRNFASGGAVALANGVDGNLWYVDGMNAAVNRFSLQSSNYGAVRHYATSDGNVPLSLTTGPDGALWFTESAGAVGRLSTSGITQVFLNPQGEGGTSMVSGPDGNLWFIDTQQIFKISTGGTITGYGVLNDKLAQPLAASVILPGIHADLWIGSSDGEVCDVTTAGIVSACVQTHLASVTSLAFGPDGKLWVLGPTATGGSGIDAVTPGAYGYVANFALQSGTPAQDDFAIGSGNTLWFGMGTGGVDILSLPVAAAPAHR